MSQNFRRDFSSPEKFRNFIPPHFIIFFDRTMEKDVRVVYVTKRDRIVMCATQKQVNVNVALELEENYVISASHSISDWKLV